MKKIINVFKRAVNTLRNFYFRRIKKKIEVLLSDIETGFIDDIIELILKGVKLFIYLDPEYKKNIEDFDGRYTFRSERGKIAASAIFKNGTMKVKKKEIKNTNVTVFFSDGRAMWDFMTAANPDIFAFILDNKIRYEGNLNYLLKFAYMGKHLKYKLGFE